MLRNLTVLLLVCAPLLAQSELPPQAPQRAATRALPPGELSAPVAVPADPAPSARPSRRGLEPNATPAWRDGSLTNYRIVLEVEPKGQPKQRMSLVMAEGSAELNTVDPNSVEIDGNPVPSTVTLSVTLEEINESRCALKLLFGHTVPFVSGSMGGPGRPTRSMVQQISVGLDTSLILRPGQSILVQDTEKEQITITLNRVE